MELKKILEQLEFSKFNGVEDITFANTDSYKKSTVNENTDDDIVEHLVLNEVADNGSIKLYETESNGYMTDTIIRKYIPELFPDFKFNPIDLNKCYILGDENGLYFGQ